MRKLRFNNFVFNLLIVALFLSPNILIVYFLQLFVLVSIGLRSKNSFTYKLPLKIFFLVFVFIVLILNINSVINVKDYLIVINIFTLIFLFPYFKGFNLNLKLNVVYAIILYIVLSQVAYLFEVTSLTNIYNYIYFSDGFDGLPNYVGNLRLGGIYFNPNQASKYLTIILCLILEMKSTLSTKKEVILNGIFVFILLISIILTGSRTGFLIAISTILFQMLIIEKRYLILIPLVPLILLYILFSGISYRVLEISETGSLDYKFDAIFNYTNTLLKSNDFINFVFGNFTSDYNSLAVKWNTLNNFQFGFDAEIGMLLSSLGIIGILIVSYFVISIFISLNKHYTVLFFPFFLWIFTSTILYSFRTSIVYFTILGYYYCKNLNNKKINAFNRVST